MWASMPAWSCLRERLWKVDRSNSRAAQALRVDTFDFAQITLNGLRLRPGLRAFGG
jgi:hypothetical protein